MPALPKDMVAVAIKTGASTRAQVTTAPRFKAGDKVVARNINPPTHTRLPRYIRGKHAVVQHNHGGFAFADTRAHGLGDQPRTTSTACVSKHANYGATPPHRATRSISPPVRYRAPTNRIPDLP